MLVLSGQPETVRPSYVLIEALKSDLRERPRRAEFLEKLGEVIRILTGDDGEYGFSASRVEVRM
jgi:hypothetical protein